MIIFKGVYSLEIFLKTEVFSKTEQQMLRKELDNRSGSELRAGLKFWGVKEGQDFDGLVIKDRGFKNLDNKELVYKKLAARMSSKYEVALHLGGLDPGELTLLGALIKGEGVCLRGNISEKFRDEHELQSALKRLKDKFFIYLRKDRRLLTDRYDKIYLFPEIFSALKSLSRLDRTGIRRHLKGLIHPCVSTSDERLRNLLLLGGFAPMGWDRSGDFRTLFKEGKIGITLLDLETCLVPAWILTADSLVLLKRDGPERMQFKPNTYLITIIKIVDCLLYRSFSNRNARRVVSACVKKYAAGSGESERYYSELKSLELFVESDNRISVHEGSTKLGYQGMVSFLKNQLTVEERNILSLVKKRRCCSVLWIISVSMMEHLIEHIFSCLPSDILSLEEQRKSCRRHEIALVKLIFRGFLLQDFSEAYLRTNAMEEGVYSKDSIILNTDREILVFSERISHYALYVLLGFSNLEHVGPLIRLRIDRDSIARGVEYVGNVDLFIDCLGSCVKGELSPSLIEQINGWAASVKRAQVRKCWIISVNSPQTKLKLYQNRYLQSFLENETDTYILLRREVDIDRLRLELRGENIFLNMEEK